MEANQGGEKWQNGLCSWSHIDNTRNCCCGYWCGLCQIEQTADRLEISDSWLGDNCWLSISLLCLVPCFPIFILRQKTREKFGIEGNCCQDATVAVCCGCCANIQMASELDDRGVPKY